MDLFLFEGGVEPFKVASMKVIIKFQIKIIAW